MENNEETLPNSNQKLKRDSVKMVLIFFSYYHLEIKQKLFLFSPKQTDQEETSQH